MTTEPSDEPDQPRSKKVRHGFNVHPIAWLVVFALTIGLWVLIGWGGWLLVDWLR